MKPRLRGVLHQYSFFISLPIGALLIAGAGTFRARLAAAIYACALSGLFASSTLYHRIPWSPTAKRWMRRVDHSMIFFLIAGTYTPFAMLVANGMRSITVLLAVWGAALTGALVKLLWIDSSRWITVAIAFAMGWLIVGMTPGLALQPGPVATSLLVIGGVLYSMGALVYAFRRPNPFPRIFGYHEVFHTFVIVAAAAHYASIAFFVIPNANG